jgi:hypothetical protein
VGGGGKVVLVLLSSAGVSRGNNAEHIQRLYFCLSIVAILGIEAISIDIESAGIK